MVKFSLLAAEIAVWELGAPPANFNDFRVLASLLQRRRATEVNQTCTMSRRLMAGTLCIHFCWLLPAHGILPGANFTLRPNIAFCSIGSVTARHSSSGRQPNFAAFSRGRHLYSAGRPSRWASAHILVSDVLEIRKPRKSATYIHKTNEILPLYEVPR